MSNIKKKLDNLDEKTTKLLDGIYLCKDVITVAKEKNIHGYKAASIDYMKSKSYVEDCLKSLKYYGERSNPDPTMDDLKKIRESLKKHHKCFYDLMQQFPNINISEAQNFINNCDKVYNGTSEIISDLKELIDKREKQ